jgi:hypothetical protein
MTDLHEMAEEAALLQMFGSLDLTNMARHLSELKPIAPSEANCTCRPDSLCWVHRGQKDWHRELAK